MQGAVLRSSDKTLQPGKALSKSQPTVAAQPPGDLPWGPVRRGTGLERRFSGPLELTEISSDVRTQYVGIVRRNRGQVH